MADICALCGNTREWHRNPGASGVHRFTPHVRRGRQGMSGEHLEGYREGYLAGAAERDAIREELARANKGFDRPMTTSCGHTWTLRATACPECFAALRERVKALEAALREVGEDVRSAQALLAPEPAPEKAPAPDELVWPEPNIVKRVNAVMGEKHERPAFTIESEAPAPDLVGELVEALESIERTHGGEPCWCYVAISRGFSQHTSACMKARALLARTKERGR